MLRNGPTILARVHISDCSHRTYMLSSVNKIYKGASCTVPGPAFDGLVPFLAGGGVAKKGSSLEGDKSVGKIGGDSFVA